MRRNDIPTSPRQILCLALTIIAPLLFAAALVAWAPEKPGRQGGETLLAAAIIGFILVALLAMVVATARRHVVELNGDVLVIRHSVYTLTVNRRHITSADLDEVRSIEQLGLSTRKNGIAAFGYFSGWFQSTHGELTFCAISKAPLYLITFDGHVKCRQLAIGASAETARSIVAWANA